VATDTRTFVDTDVLIDIARKNLRALDFWRHAEARSAMTCSVISAFELLAGCRNLREQRATLRSLATIEVIQVESGDSSHESAPRSAPSENLALGPGTSISRSAAAFDSSSLRHERTELVQPGRQRKSVRARSTLVYVAREWGKVTVKQLKRRLHRDPSIISRLYMTYAANRDRSKETFLAKQLRQ
jgi:hypothetical protein